MHAHRTKLAAVCVSVIGVIAVVFLATRHQSTTRIYLDNYKEASRFGHQSARIMRQWSADRDEQIALASNSRIASKFAASLSCLARAADIVRTHSDTNRCDQIIVTVDFDDDSFSLATPCDIDGGILRDLEDALNTRILATAMIRGIMRYQSGRDPEGIASFPSSTGIFHGDRFGEVDRNAWVMTVSDAESGDGPVICMLQWRDMQDGTSAGHDE